MKTDNLQIFDKAGNELNNDDVTYFETTDSAHKFPMRRAIRYALNKTNKIFAVDCAGMEGQGDFGFDSFMDYFSDTYPQLSIELYTMIDDDPDFRDLLVDIYTL